MNVANQVRNKEIKLVKWVASPRNETITKNILKVINFRTN